MTTLFSIICAVLLSSPFAFADQPIAWQDRFSTDAYDYVDAQKLIPADAKKKALAYFELYKDRVPNKNYISVFDASQISSQPRLFLIHIPTGNVESYLVAHGQGSDRDHDGYAESFSNVINSYATSLGFYFTGSTYFGENGYSLKLKGIETTNSNAYARAIVVHGASYVDSGLAKKHNKIGRSQGCPAVENHLAKPIIDKIKNGSVFYIWKP